MDCSCGIYSGMSEGHMRPADRLESGISELGLSHTIVLADVDVRTRHYPRTRII
jgi:hypothetical protein